MNIEDILYDKRLRFGFRDDVSINDLRKLLDFVKIMDDNKICIDNKDIIKLVDISLKMKLLLTRCRNNKLPLDLSRDIDNLLKEIDYL